ncbi:hypothetical protein MMC14_002257 [Varicellaria rhodocarpa]|nr:hypothetical protein [Varicellaria rhodocarpa]
MALLSFRVIVLSFVFNFYFHLCNTQLTGLLTRSLEDPEIVSAIITNEDSVNISVLNHNNVFDISTLSNPFTLTDLSGNRIPLAWTQKMYTVESFLTLLPGGTFRRQFNLTDYVNLETKETTTKTILATLPSVVQGFRNMSRPHHPQIAPLDLVNQQPHYSVGQSLADISIQSDTLQLNWTFLASKSNHLEDRQLRGLRILQDYCVGNDMATVYNAVLDAGYLAGAGINAATSFREVPFSYFFKHDIITSNKVASLYNRVILAQRGSGTLIGVSCSDTYKHCDDNDKSITPSYSIQPPGQAPIIVLCPLGMALPRNPVPCTQFPSIISLGWIMLHSLVHVKSISGADEDISLDVLDQTGDTARDVGNAVGRGQDTTTDAKAYSYLGSYSWDLGLGGPPWNQQKVCLKNFWHSKFDFNLFYARAGTK